MYTNSFASNYCFCFQGNGIGEATGGRYRYFEDGSTGGRYRNIDGYSVEKTRFTGTKATLYANGESVGVNRFSSTGESSGRAYFGTDILGSVRSATTDGASIEDRYEYDAFGTPYKDDFNTGLGNGYTGKPYDQTTGLYNYGFRDYSPQTARFTTVDPIRDGNNWFSYVVNDPVNYVDLWGLECSPILDRLDEKDAFTIINNAISDLEQLENWGNTPKFRVEAIELLRELNKDGNIRFTNNLKGSRAIMQPKADGTVDYILINSDKAIVPEDSVEGRLGHEITHAIDGKYREEGVSTDDQLWATEQHAREVAHQIDIESGVIPKGTPVITLEAIKKAYGTPYADADAAAAIKEKKGD